MTIGIEQPGRRCREQNEPASCAWTRGGTRGTWWRRKEIKILPPAGRRTYKGVYSSIAKIAHDTFNTGQNKFVAQFMQSRNNVSNYLQGTSASKGYLVAETVQTGKEQTIPLSSTVDPNVPGTEALKIIRDEEVKTIAKRRFKLQDVQKKGYVTVYNQCSQEV